MSVKPFKSTVPNQLWDEIKLLNEQAMSIQKIADTINNKHNVKIGNHAIRKLCKYFQFKPLEDIPSISMKSNSTKDTKDTPNRENYIGWVKDKLLDLAQTSFQDKKYDMFLKTTDRLIAIYRIERPLEVIQSAVSMDYGKEAFKAEIKNLIKPPPPRATGTSD